MNVTHILEYDGINIIIFRYQIVECNLTNIFIINIKEHVVNACIVVIK